MTDSEAITQIIARQVDGWNRADARAWVEACDVDVSFTNIVGMRWESRAGSEERHAEMFRGAFRGSHLTMVIERLRFPGPDTAVVELLTTLTGARAMPPGIRPEADGVLHTRMLEIFVRRDDGWRIAASHNTAVQAQW